MTKTKTKTKTKTMTKTKTKTKTKLVVDNNPGWEVNLRECIPPHELLIAGHTGGAATLHYTSSAFLFSLNHHRILNDIHFYVIHF